MEEASENGRGSEGTIVQVNVIYFCDLTGTLYTSASHTENKYTVHSNETYSLMHSF